MPRKLSCIVTFTCSMVFSLAAWGDIPEGVKNSQDPKDKPLSPQEALQTIRVPEGFRVTLFAGDPDVAQPISMTFDDRGRLWVAECFSYPEWKLTGGDRILIFEDTDNDGRFDQRKVFWDKAYNLTGLAIGFGGVWACCAPHLLFIPDADGDDVPDGKPEVRLDGWTLEARHNIYSGMQWGPDGWLYGRHGIVADSLIGTPGTPEEKRVRMNCGIWRYHPQRQQVEAIAHGTTNPWGLDWDDHGELFFTNNVIGHLWHVVYGAHYKRMYGQDFNPYTYELMDSTSDHLHWGGGKWTESRGGMGIHSKAGGGHSHCGGMIYLGDNWPDRYRNNMLMCNTHGRRLNCDVLDRKACGYVARHDKDIFMVGDPWFRGTGVKYGPDGGVFVTDWSDVGECHDNDGVHRRSGRIYKVVYGKVIAPANLNVAKKTDDELVELQLHKNDWFVRVARRNLQERSSAGRDMTNVHQQLTTMFNDHPDVTRKLRALWALVVTDGAPESWLLSLLDHGNEHIRSWAVRLLTDGHAPSDAARAKFEEMARTDKSGLVRLYLASSLQRMPLAERWSLAEGLVGRQEDDSDGNLSLLIWYGVEPAVPVDRARALKLLAGCKLSKVRQLTAKRIAAASK